MPHLIACKLFYNSHKTLLVIVNLFSKLNVVRWKYYSQLQMIQEVVVPNPPKTNLGTFTEITSSLVHLC